MTEPAPSIGATVLDNLSALVRTRCAPHQSSAGSSSEDEDQKSDLECASCSGVDDVACDEFLDFLRSHKDASSDLRRVLCDSNGEWLLRQGIVFRPLWHRYSHVACCFHGTRRDD